VFDVLYFLIQKLDQQPLRLVFQNQFVKVYMEVTLIQITVQRISSIAVVTMNVKVVAEMLDRIIFHMLLELVYVPSHPYNMRLLNQTTST
jgi:hypothetical protein